MPVGSIAGVHPPTFQHRIPASQRKYFCSSRGDYVNMHADYTAIIGEEFDMATQERLNCHFGVGQISGIPLRLEYLESVFVLCPPFRTVASLFETVRFPPLHPPQNKLFREVANSSKISLKCGLHWMRVRYQLYTTILPLMACPQIIQSSWPIYM